MKKYNFFISLCLSLLFVCGALFSMFLRITLVLLMLSIYDLFIVDQLPRDFEISYWKQLRDYLQSKIRPFRLPRDRRPGLFLRKEQQEIVCGWYTLLLDH